jgi:hypothetical protein
MGESTPIQSSGGPREIYRERQDQRLQAAARHRRAGELLAWVRLAIFLAGAAACWPALVSQRFGWPWLLLPAAAFLSAVALHDRVIRRRTRAERAAEFCERGLERLEDRWAGLGNDGERFLEPAHPYASDLDLFGPGSLFELICAARTVPGERTLADWLCRPAPPAEIRERQQAVEELRPRLDLREDLALLGEDARSQVDADDLRAWGEARRGLPPGWVGWLVAAVAVSNVATLLAWTSSVAGPIPFLLSAACGLALAGLLRGRVDRVLNAVESRERGLELLALVLRRLENERFHSPLLARLRADLDNGGRPPWKRIALLARLAQVSASRRNMLFAPFAALGLLGTQIAFAMERWRTTSGASVGRWLDALGGLEALSSLAGYAWERPEDPFPEIAGEGPGFDGRELGHPLLPAARCVRNDVRLGDGLRLLIVSGSNMSGKSTLLRTVGVNAVLALAGAPVRAASLRLSPLAVGAAMRVQDSLQEGLSHFYAEIKRLRSLVDICDGETPLLFLLDDVLHGTNSHDRRVGAEALLRGLVERGAIGLVTTHDLALTEIAGRFESRAKNVHFEDQLEGERMRFDFRLRPGVVRQSNALRLMRTIGLDV